MSSKEASGSKESQNRRGHPVLGAVALATVVFVVSGHAERAWAAITAGLDEVPAAMAVTPKPAAAVPVQQPAAPAPTQPAEQLPHLSDPTKDAIIQSLHLRQSQKDYIRRMLPIVMEKYNQGAHINPADMLAQAEEETGHGDFAPRHANWGVKTYGKSVGTGHVEPTHEVINGKSVPVNGEFEGYPSDEASADGYVAFIENNSNYADARANYKDPNAYLECLQNGGIGHTYATAPDYVSKIQALIRDDRLIELTS